MTISIITGGAGFIGAHLAERLAAEGHDVFVVDNLSTGSMSNLAGFLDQITFVETDAEAYEHSGSVDYIFHLASVANPADYVMMQSNVLSSASDGTRRMLRIADREGARMIYFSSSEVYGSHPEGACLSESSMSNVKLNTSRSAYLVAKMFGEQTVLTSRIETGVDARIVRPFNIYGRRMDSKSPYGRVMVNFLRSSFERRPLTVNGDGFQTRSFCHVSDFIDGLLRYTESETDEPIVNIGNPVPTRIIDLAETVIKLTGSDSGIVHAPQVEFEPRHRCPDITLIKRICGWSPKISLEEGLREMIPEYGIIAPQRRCLCHGRPVLFSDCLSEYIHEREFLVAGAIHIFPHTDHGALAPIRLSDRVA